jgi:hypothetical protein
MFIDDYPIVIWTIEKIRDYYLLKDSCGLTVMRRAENRKHEIYQYCKDNGIELQEEF